MPGITLNESSSCDNPLLQFYYQANGKLANVAELNFSVYDLTSKEERVSSTVVNLDTCANGGSRLSTGRYAANFTASSSSWKKGTHEIRWTYKPAATDSTRTWRQRFEVLDPDLIPTGQGYRTCADSIELVNNSAFLGCEAPQIQESLRDATQLIESITGRIFEPTYIDARYNGTKAAALPLGHPIIGIDAVDMMTSNDIYLSVELDDLVVYNRHLTTGLRDPDDRDNPRIEFVTSLSIEGYPLLQSFFYRGRQNIHVSGVFGYTEYDGTPVGARPRQLARIAGILALRQIKDPFGLDVAVSQPGRIRSARTRDQAVTFATARDGGVGALTGDRTVDDILIAYMRPPHYGAVHDTSRSETSRSEIRDY
jgi:hypothetical protein